MIKIKDSDGSIHIFEDSDCVLWSTDAMVKVYNPKTKTTISCFSSPVFAMEVS